MQNKSSRSRSRSKNNRNRGQNNSSGGNVVNRVFDSSGPESKVRGTPQQIIEKYNQLARDAQLSNDRVAAENFQQHAEHYTRMLAEAQREIDSRRDEQERQNRERQAERDRERIERQEREAAAAQQAEAQQAEARKGSGDQPDVVEHPAPPVESDDGLLVDTPENAPKPKPRRARKPRVRKETVEEGAAAPAPAPADTAPQDSASASDAAAESAPDAGDTPKAAE